MGDFSYIVNIALFLGAGASVVYEKPTTKEFKRLLEELVLSQTKDDPKYNLLKALLKIETFLDVEYILKALDDIHIFLKSKGGEFFSNFRLHGSTIITIINDFEYEYDDLLKHVLDVKVIIEKQVFEKYRWNPDHDTLLNDIFSPLLKQLDPITNNVKIFTTNYDMAIEEFCNGNDSHFYCNDGFKADSGRHGFFWNRGNYDELDVPGKVNLQLYKLHGSLNWKNHKTHGAERITNERKIDDSDIRHDGDLLVYPSLSPKDGMEKEPFKTITHKFNNFLSKSDICFVIGFSFRDEHLNKIFERFIKSGKKLIVISPSSSRDLERFEYKIKSPYNVKNDSVFSLSAEKYTIDVHGYRVKFNIDNIDSILIHIALDMQAV